MPCYQLNKIEVEFNLKHFHLIEKAAESLGWKIAKTEEGFNVLDQRGRTLFSYEDGKAIIAKPLLESKVNKLKQAYSRQALKHAARKTGWTQEKRGNKLVFTKKTF